MNITATHINYYHVCKRKLWLFATGVQMEHNSELVSEGNLIHETTYPQRPVSYEELSLDSIKIDFYDKHSKVIHEIKKSNKIEVAHIWQLKYYIHILSTNGVEGVTGILEYPKLRTTKTVELSEDEIPELQRICRDIEEICSSTHCPALIQKKYCRSCSYFEFCYSNDME